jgi:hypothetical protein
VVIRWSWASSTILWDCFEEEYRSGVTDLQNHNFWVPEQVCSWDSLFGGQPLNSVN